VHASPRDLQFGYIATDAPDPIWRDALAPAGTPAFVFVGHTHDQFTRQIDETMVVNPGTVGLPKDGDPRAAYAVYRDGRIELRRVSYDTERAAARIVALPLPSHQTRRLADWIRHARLP
jgi:diadenosine tetraphosphatase ApaH/serine/threonine PP2A family protein phosphatase